MDTKTVRLLGEILNVSKRIESSLNKSSAADTSGGSIGEDSTISGISGNIISGLNEIKKETKKSNQLLGKIDHNIEQLAKNGGIGISAEGSKNIGNTIKESAKAISKIAGINENKLEKVSTVIKDIIMISVFKDKDTGKEYITDTDLEKGERGMEIIKSISSGIIKFGLNMSLFNILAVPAMLGATMLAGIVRIMMKILSPVEFSEETERAVSSLKKLGVSVALFGATMAAFSLGAPLIAKGALTFVMVVGVMGVSLVLLYGIINLGGRLGVMPENPANMDGPLGSLWKLAAGVAMFGVTMILFGLVRKQVWNGMGVFAATLGIAVGAILAVHILTGLGKSKGVADSTPLGSLWKLAAGIAMFGAVMAIIGIPKVKSLIESGMGIMVKTLGLLAGALIIYGTGIVKKGTKSMLFAVGALAALVGTLAIYSMIADKLTWESIGMLGAVIVGLGAAMAAAGVGAMPANIALGSAAMIIAGGALATISGGLLIYAGIADKLTWESIGMLGAVIVGLGAAMAAAGALSLLIAPGAAVMLVAAGALYPITKSLEIFKGIQWQESDTENLKFAVGGVREAFASGGIRQWTKAGFGALMASRMGKSLVGLASGIESFANMNYTEFAYDEKTGEMKPVRIIKLSKEDIKSAAENIGMVLTTMIDPLTQFGEMITGSAKSGNFFQRIGFQKSGVQKGISSFTEIGEGIANLSTGVQDWANMTITEWKVVDNKIVPVRKRKIKPTEITDAAANIAETISALIVPISDFGNIFEGKRGRGLFGFGKDNITKGIESFSTVSESISTLSKGVQDWANMTVTTYKVKDDKIVPEDIIPLGSEERKAATKNIAETLSALIIPISDFGNIFEGKRGRGLFGFGKDSITKGIESFGLVSESISTLSKGVQDWANMTVTTYKVKDDKIVPEDIIPLDSSQLDSATKNITKVLNTLINPIVKWSEELENRKKKKIKKGGEVVTLATGIIANVTESIKTATAQIKKVNQEANITEITKFINWFKEISDTEFGEFSNHFRTFPDSVRKFHRNFKPFIKEESSIALDSFTNNIIRLSRSSHQFKSFVNSFDKMSISLEKFGNTFKGLLPDGILAFSEWTNALTKAIEIGKSENTGAMDSFLNESNKSINSGLQFGKNMLGGDDIDNEEANSIIDKTIKDTSDADPKMQLLIESMSKLQLEMQEIKSVLAGELQVYVAGVDNNAQIRINDL